MANGANSLDEKGCEYGRITRREYDILKEELQNVKLDQKDLDTVVRKIEKAIAANSWQTLVAQIAIQAAVMGVGLWAMTNVIKTALGG